MSRTSQFTLQCKNCKGTEEVTIKVTTKGPFVVKSADWCVAAAKYLHYSIDERGVLCELCALKEPACPVHGEKR